MNFTEIVQEFHMDQFNFIGKTQKYDFFPAIKQALSENTAYVGLYVYIFGIHAPRSRISKDWRPWIAWRCWERFDQSWTVDK
jgi:hypothetical protein